MLYIDCFLCKYSFYVAFLQKYRKIKKFGDFRKKIFSIFWGFLGVTFPGSTRDFTKNGKIPGKKKIEIKKNFGRHVVCVPNIYYINLPCDNNAYMYFTSIIRQIT